MALARVTLFESCFGGTTTTIAASKKDERRKLPKWGRDHDQNSVPQHLYTFSSYSHDLQTLFLTHFYPTALEES